MDLCSFQTFFLIALVTSGKLFYWPGWMMGNRSSNLWAEPDKSLQQWWRKKEVLCSAQSMWGLGPLHSVQGWQCSPASGWGGHGVRTAEIRSGRWVGWGDISLCNELQEIQQPRGPQLGSERRPLCWAWFSSLIGSSILPAISMLPRQMARPLCYATAGRPCHPVPAKIIKLWWCTKDWILQKMVSKCQCMVSASCGSFIDYSFIFLPS